MLSKDFSNTTNKYDIKIGGVNKLVPNLGNKSQNVFITEIFSCIFN